MGAYMDGMQIGKSMTKLRLFESQDSTMFTGCCYAGITSAPDRGSAAPEDAEEGSQDELSSAQRLFRSLPAHYLEIFDVPESKMERLKELIELYSPNQEQQMMIIASPCNLA